MKERSFNEVRVLIMAPSGRDAELSEQLLSGAGILTKCCGSVADLFTEIESGSGTVLIASEILTPSVVASLSQILQRQPAWSDVSIIVITGAGTGFARSNQLKELSVLTNAVLLERPVRSATIVNSVKIALRARERQYVMRDHLVERTRLEMQLAEAYRKQHRIAETLQRSMLSRPAKDTFPSIELETLYVAATEEAEVGGDFFDVFAIDEKRVAFVVGDVSGKGLDAASRSLEVRYPVRAFLRFDPSPSIAMQHLNDYVTDARRLDHSGDTGFVCMCICVLDCFDGKMTWSSAGMEGPIVVGQHRKVVLGPSGTPIGVISHYQYDEHCSTIQDGETVILFTDGVTEARNGRHFFGTEGIVESLEGKETSNLEILVKTISDSAMKFSKNENNDDVCIVAFRRKL